MNPFQAGVKCLIDGKIEAIIVKSLNRAFSRFVVEIPGKSVETIDRDRLQLIPVKSV